ncbi:MAG: hypothetical protein A3C53_08430 [Omnitrophica WOR_2 bacterium RIFCSPHIGHO2_02_FULL_68_15]|nr:MAG: hypothetical protein A3C53_08430 [Omnitrophica WOR_2 bacterium RIFCSPHIGHO2_02_FULL_68_15]
MIGAWRRRRAAGLLVLGLVSFPNLPESPAPPATVSVALYVWNAAAQPSEIAVAVDGAWVFHDTVAAEQGVSREEGLALVEGPHTAEVVVGTLRRSVPLTVTADGNRWLVVTWWGQGELEAGLQRQPPWIAGQTSP